MYRIMYIIMYRIMYRIMHKIMYRIMYRIYMVLIGNLRGFYKYPDMVLEGQL